MRESEDARDPYKEALDSLRTAGLIPRPICGCRTGDSVAVLECRGALTTAQREQISRAMGALPYTLDEVVTGADGLLRRVEDSRVLGGPIYRTDVEHGEAGTMPLW
jgi:hypothetical protein